MTNANELDPKKFHILGKKQKLIIFFVAIGLFLLVFPPTLYFYYNISLNRPSQTSKEVTFEIKKGQGLIDIADNLYESGAINSKFLFSFYAITNKFDSNIQAGIYTIKAGTSIKNLVQLLQHGTLDTSITFLEGWRIEEFARKAAATFKNVGYEEFVTLAKDKEGYLFPDTYIFSAGVNTAEMIDHLQDIFKAKTKDLLSDAYLEKSGLTAEQAVIFASIVERESADEDNRPLVAGILIKRWKEGMKIEADATTQYAVAPLRFGCSYTQTEVCPINGIAAKANWWPNDLTTAELNYDSPYNTRKHGGLPPAPISSVSISSLKAVVNYTESDYYFYLNDSDGKTHFAKTLKEHNANIEKYLSK